jgi:hypothetical protein
VHEKEIRRAFLEAFDRAARSVDRQAAIEALQANDVAGALEILQLRDAVLAPLAEAIRGAYVDGGTDIVTAMPASRVVMGFDARSVRAERWISQHAAARVVEIVADQRKAIREAVLAQVREGRNPRAIITDLVGKVSPNGRTGGIIGLTSKQASYVANARGELVNLNADYFSRVRRDRRFDRLVQRAIRLGEPLSSPDLDRITARYSDRLLAYRAEVVSRTESINALRAGRHEGMEQGVDAGAYLREQVKVVWSATMDERTRDDHQALNGQEVEMGEAFVFPDGSQALFPGDDSMGAPADQLIQCRCYAGYSVDWLRDARRQGTA